MPSNHLILCHPLLLPSIFPRIRVFSSESLLHIRLPKFQLQHQYFQCIFRTDFLQDGLSFGSPCSPRDSQESSPTPQFKNINSLALSFLYSPALTSIHDYWKNHSFDYMDFVGKIMSLLFSMLSKLVFSSMEQAHFNFMAAVTICSDFGDQKVKSVTVSIVSLIYLP